MKTFGVEEERNKSFGVDEGGKSMSTKVKHEIGSEDKEQLISWRWRAYVADQTLDFVKMKE